MEAEAGPIPWIYLDTDTPPVPTVGYGHALVDADHAAAVFGVDLSVMEPEWSALKKAPGGKLPQTYESYTGLRLSTERSTALFRSDLTASLMECAARIPTFPQLPQAAQVVSNDINFNVGDVRAFHHFLANLAVNDWKQAAASCHRIERPAPGGIQPARNRAATALLLTLCPQPLT